jgi:DNA-binding MarR family transcriptional regulator
MHAVSSGLNTNRPHVLAMQGLGQLPKSSSVPPRPLIACGDPQESSLAFEKPITKDVKPVFLTAEDADAAEYLLQRIAISRVEGPPTSAGKVDLHNLAARLYAARRIRERFLPRELLGEPAWDMLLILYSSEGRAEELSISSVCHAADVPQSTAMRWATTLMEMGLIFREPHKTDQRSVVVRLTADGRSRIETLLRRCARQYFPN